MLAKLLKANTANIACAPFIIPSESEEISEEVIETAPIWEVDEQAIAPINISAISIPSIEDQIEAERAKAESQASGIVDAARAQANKMIMDAEAQIERIEREAVEKGLFEAQARMQSEIDQATEALRSQLAQSLHEIAALRQTLAEQVELELVRLALEIAKKVVQREVQLDPDIPLTLTRIALSRIHRATATVRLHPDDFEYVNSRRDKLRAEGLIEIVADAGVSRGGCVIQSERGDV
ncbi:MAG TPA: FliH/SctL family protein, partial [Blastocatellia bacterium]|nr:FliH/SctL family protein [Blastocatellia bacterium]